MALHGPEMWGDSRQGIIIRGNDHGPKTSTSGEVNRFDGGL
jgi:hypothetical protein